MILPDISRHTLKASEHPAVKAGREAETRKAAGNPEFWAHLARLGGWHPPAPAVSHPPPSVAHLAPRAVLAAMTPPRKATLRDIAKAAVRGAAKLQRR